jgi:hypothetical protein
MIVSYAASSESGSKVLVVDTFTKRRLLFLSCPVLIGQLSSKIDRNPQFPQSIAQSIKKLSEINPIRDLMPAVLLQCFPVRAHKTHFVCIFD